MIGGFEDSRIRKKVVFCLRVRCSRKNFASKRLVGLVCTVSYQKLSPHKIGKNIFFISSEREVQPERRRLTIRAGFTQPPLKTE
jgi:hypothetical protein